MTPSRPSTSRLRSLAELGLRAVGAPVVRLARQALALYSVFAQVVAAILVGAVRGREVVTEQIDALRMCNADPIRYLIVPRTLACAVMLVVLTIYAVIVATLAGMTLAWAVFDINTSTFLSLQLVTTDDVIIGLVKALAYGFWIPIVAGQAGLAASGGSAGVGWATTRAVVNTSFAVVLLDFVISGIGYAIFDL